MLENKSTVTEMKNVFDGLISKEKTAEGRNLLGYINRNLQSEKHKDWKKNNKKNKNRI